MPAIEWAVWAPLIIGPGLATLDVAHRGFRAMLAGESFESIMLLLGATIMVLLTESATMTALHSTKSGELYLSRSLMGLDAAPLGDEGTSLSIGVAIIVIGVLAGMAWTVGFAAVLQLARRLRTEGRMTEGALNGAIRPEQRFHGAAALALLAVIGAAYGWRSAEAIAYYAGLLNGFMLAAFALEPALRTYAQIRRFLNG